MSEKLLDILKPQEDCLPEEMLIRYAQGTLSASEARRVEEHISECSFCSDALDGIMQNGNVKHFHSQLSSIKKIVHKKISRGDGSETFPVTRVLAIAATLMLLAISAWYVQYVVNSSSQKIFSNQFEPYPVPQMENNTGAVAAPDTEHKAQPPVNKSSELKKIAPNPVQHNEKDIKQPQALEQPAPAEKKASEQSSTTTVNRNADMAVEEDKSLQKISPDTVVVLSPSQSVNYASPSPAFSQSQSRESVTMSDIVTTGKTDSYKKDVTPDFNKAMAFYQSDRYAEAIAEFQLVLKEEPGNPAANFYSGVSSLALKNPDEALKFFKKTDYKSCQYYEATLWYQALSYISKDDKKQAKKLLERVSQLNGEYKVKAEETLKQL